MASCMARDPTSEFDVLSAGASLWEPLTKWSREKRFDKSIQATIGCGATSVKDLLIRLAQVDQQHRLGRDNYSATARASPRAKSGRRWPSRSRVLSASCARSVEPPWSNESAPKRPNPTSWHETH